MKFDLTKLGEMHPVLVPSADMLSRQAALGFGRHGYLERADISLLVNQESRKGTLCLENYQPSDAKVFDPHRTTEDAAEAVSLAIVNQTNGWVLVRRLHRGEYGDFLLKDTNDSRAVLEVSGIDRGGSISVRVKEKQAQVARCTLPVKKWTCVVRLKAPEAHFDELTPHTGEL